MNFTSVTDAACVVQDLGQSASIDTGFGISSPSEINQFQECLDQVGQTSVSSDSMDVARAALEPFNNLNVKAAELAEFATKATANGESFTPSEIVTLTYKAQEFGFHSQLTANIANRLADGVSQLFRQQG